MVEYLSVCCFVVHKTSMEHLHSILSSADTPAPPLDHQPIASLSFSIVPHHVVLSLPFVLFPSEGGAGHCLQSLFVSFIKCIMHQISYNKIKRHVKFQSPATSTSPRRAVLLQWSSSSPAASTTNLAANTTTTTTTTTNTNTTTTTTTSTNTTNSATGSSTPTPTSTSTTTTPTTSSSSTPHCPPSPVLPTPPSLLTFHLCPLLPYHLHLLTSILTPVPSTSPTSAAPSSPPPPPLHHHPQLPSYPTTISTHWTGTSGLSLHLPNLRQTSPLPEDTMITPSSPNITQTGGVKSSTSPAKCSSTALRRRSSDSDLSTTPKGGSLTGSSGSGSGTGALSGLSGRISGHKSALAQPQPTIDMLEYPFFTMKTFPPGFIVHIGGIVSAKSVKLLDKIHNPEEPETRDAWWIEIRTEIRSHCRAMGCHAVIGYSEETSICDEVIILSAIGTAAVVNSNLDVLLPIGTHKEIPQPTQVQVGDRVPVEKEKLFVDVNLANQLAQNSIEDGYTPVNCAVCHIPYKSVTMPFKVTLGTCAICHKQPVPDVLFTTINPPEEIQTLGKGTLIQARIYRTKKDGKGEACAKEISDCLPFMEYELHNQLINKLKMRGMNGLFGLVVHITIGETMLAGIATATAAFLSPLPAPSIPRISGQVMTATDNTDLEMLQQRLTTAEIVQTQFGSRIGGGNNTDDSDDDQGDIELSFGNKDTFVLEVDDAKDETVSLILDDFTAPEGFEICNTETLPGVTNIVCNLQMFTHVWRGKCQKNPMTVKDFSDLFNHLIRKICFKLRKMAPCCLSCLDFNLELADEDEVQITVTGMCTGLGEIQPQISDRKQEHGSSLLLGVPSNSSCEQDPDMMFTMEEIQDSPVISRVISQAPKPMKLENGMKYHTVPRHRLGVELIPMSYVPGGKIDHYLGSYNFFFIRESTSVREMGGPCGFMQSFVSEVKAIVRAHVGALGGNAMVAYKMNECILLNNPHKNQCQCLINVSGDAVNVLYSFDLPPELSHANCGVAGSGGGSRGDLAAHPSVSGSSTPRPLSGSPVIS
ncbi:C2 domain-containing protein 5 [Acanthosepion pharaonis]|uniref:C2 domain-containing protein 5 n=1 Tax=Acanthosepion pharaonis TaxID=158019 RepID=A0A812CFF5_ACAPH|nr:C2 domain-containing protein 5 [Sepia pharaonis]